MKNILKSLILIGIAVVGVSPFSCKVTEQGIMLLNNNDDYKFPVLDSFYVTNGNSVRLVFTESVDLKECRLSPEIEICETYVQKSSSEFGLCMFDVSFAENLEIGKDYRFYGKVSDRIGNSLTFSVPFSGFNNRIPELVISEIHPKYSSSTSKSSGETVYKGEYVELFANSAGNLSGLELYSAVDGDEKSYKFPAIEVTAGETIVVHLRKKGAGTEDELDSDLTLSTAKYSSDNARDLWAENESARLGDDIDVILLRTINDSKILDCVCYAASSYQDWKTDVMRKVVESAVEAGLWDSVDITSAVPTDGITATKTLERFLLGNNADCWQLSKTSGETPGVVQFNLSTNR